MAEGETRSVLNVRPLNRTCVRSCTRDSILGAQTPTTRYSRWSLSYFCMTSRMIRRISSATYNGMSAYVAPGFIPETMNRSVDIPQASLPLLHTGVESRAWTTGS